MNGLFYSVDYLGNSSTSSARSDLGGTVSPSYRYAVRILHLFLCLISLFALPMRECLRKRACMSFTFPIDVLNGSVIFSDSATTNAHRNPVRDGSNTNALVNHFH